MPRTSQDTPRRRAAWKALSTLTGLAGAVATRRLLQAVWPTGHDGTAPPYNPADRRVAWPTALQWAIAAGLGAGITRLLGERLAAAGWEAATGSPPPGIQT